MNSKPSLNQLRKELISLKKYRVVVYGSYTSGDYTARSDIDLAIITKVPSPEQNKKIYVSLLGKTSEKYDLKIFELLPLDIKASLMENYLVLFGDPLEISEYWYHFRKLWDDSKHRYYANQFTSIQEKMAALGMT